MRTYVLLHCIIRRMQLNESQDYCNIFLQSSGLLDVRAPIEFEQGAFPTAANLPLLDNKERHQVGLCYKHHGQQKAINIGHTLVSGEVKQLRIKQWAQFTRQHHNTYLYCFRGGLRSKISQQWLHEVGIDITRVTGGYKALRQFLIIQLENAPTQFEFVLVGGLTGCRKTNLIQNVANGIDLEGAAYHRGSSFGAHATKQSSQINFENRVSIDLLKARYANQRILVLEDEGRFIGSVDIPKNIFTKMRNSPLVVIERKLEDRLPQLLQEYVINMEREFSQLHADHEVAFEKFSEYLLSSLLRIQKRLGNKNWSELQNTMQHALKTHKVIGDTSSHLQWLEPLLVNYYDPMYTSQLKNRSKNIIFRGDYDACLQFLADYSA